MYFIMTHDNALQLKNFLNITFSDSINIEIINDLVIISIAQEDYSNFTVIKLNLEYFTSCNLIESSLNTNTLVHIEGEIELHSDGNKNRFTVPRCDFYRNNMTSCKIELEPGNLHLHFQYKDTVTSEITYNTLNYLPFEFDFDKYKTFQINIDFFKSVLSRFYSKFVEIKVRNRQLQWNVQNTMIQTNINVDFDIEFQVSWIHFKRIFTFTDYDCGYISISSDKQIIQVTFKKENVLVESYLSNYLV